MSVDGLELGEKIVAGEQIVTFAGEVGEGSLGIEEVQHVDITVTVKVDEVGEGHHVEGIDGCVLVVAGLGRRWDAASASSGSGSGSRERHVWRSI